MESANFIKRILKARTRTSYGIAVYEDRKKQGETVVRSINDITSDKRSLESFVDLCNKEKLSEIHLEEAVQDFLTENN